MNGLPLIHLALEGSSPPPCRSRGRLRGPRSFSRQPWSNTPLRSFAPRQLQTSNKDVLESPPNILTPTIPPCRRQYHQRQSTSAKLIPDKCSAISPVVLEKDFRFREDVYLTFLPEVNDSITKEAMKCFQINIKNAIKHVDYVCCCYS